MGKHSKQTIRHSNRKKILATGAITIGLLASQTSAYAAETPRTETVQSEALQRVVENSGIVDTGNLNTAITAPVTASKDATVSFEKSMVTTAPSPERVAEENRIKVQEAAKVEAEKQAVIDAEAAKVAQAEAAKAAKVAQTRAAQAPTGNANAGYAGSAQATITTGVATNKSAAILAAAKAQLGVEQDCTMLVTNALKAVGINFHGWPADYMSLGTITNNPVPGDLVYYANGGTGVPHIGVYAGGNSAVHGGWNGHTTAMGPVNLGSGAVYIHIA